MTQLTLSEAKVGFSLSIGVTVGSPIISGCCCFCCWMRFETVCSSFGFIEFSFLSAATLLRIKLLLSLLILLFSFSFFDLELFDC